MERLITPADLMTDEPPQRVMGSEHEYNVQNRDAVEKTLKREVVEKAVKNIGHGKYSASDTCYHLENGASLHGDCKHIEYAGPESRGPYEAAAADFAGIIIMQALGRVKDNDHRGIYRRTGTDFDGVDLDGNSVKDAKSSGSHVNLCMTSEEAQTLAHSPLLPNYLASRIWAFDSCIGRNGFMLSQKISGIGMTINTFQGSNRTVAGKKPMATIMIGEQDKDVNPDPGWTRVEIRYADAGTSRWGRLAEFAIASVVLRLHEHRRKIGLKYGWAFSEPLEAAHQIAADRYMSKTYKTVDGKYTTALSQQEELLKYAHILREKVRLPKYELMFIDEWQKIIDDLRACDPKNDDYSPVIDAVDCFAKFHVMRNMAELGDLSSDNNVAVAYDLLWNRIDPIGIGLRWWDKIGGRQLLLEQAVINKLVRRAPQHTRANVRSQAIREGGKVDGWSIIHQRNGKSVKIASPYQYWLN